MKNVDCSTDSDDSSQETVDVSSQESGSDTESEIDAEIETSGNANNKAFSQKYKDPVFRAAHLQYLKEKELCECGHAITRSNMAKHQRTSLHRRRMTQKELKQVQVLVDADTLRAIELMVLDLQEKINKLILTKSI